MGPNKIIYNSKVLIDLTGDSVNESKMLEGTTAHNKSGEPVIGTIKNYGPIGYGIELTDIYGNETSYIEYIEQTGYIEGGQIVISLDKLEAILADI